MATRKLEVEIVGDTASLERAFRRSSAAGRKFNSDMTRGGTAVATLKGNAGAATPTLNKLKGSYVGTTAAALAFGGAVKASFSELFESQKVSAQTEAALHSTGFAAGVTAEEVDGLAKSLLAVSGVDDEVIKSGENLLLTFTRIRNEVGVGNDVFNQATKAALDMSVALGTDMQSSALRVGKALNDPIRGITALRRVGVQFTDAQVSQIEALVKTGETMEAQKIILRELNTEFGGSAEAAGKTLPGQLSKLRESAKNLGATFANIVTPALIDATEALTDFLEGVQKLNDSPRAAAGGFFAFFKSDFARRGGEVLPTIGPFIGALNSAFPKAGKDAARGFTEGFADAVANSPRAEAAAARAAASFAATAKKEIAKAFGTGTPFLDLQQANAEATKRLSDDLAVSLHRIVVLRERLSKATGLKEQTDLQNAVNAERQRADAIRDQIRARRIAAKEAADEAFREAARRRAEATRRAAERQSARQFRLLGLGPGGSELVPNTASLRKTFARLRDAIKGTDLDTKKNRGLFAGIARVLLGEEGTVRADVRAFIDQVFDDIDEQLGKRGDTLGQKWRKINVDAFIRSLGLNLTAAQIRKLRAGLSGLGPNLTVPPSHTPAFSAATGVTVNGDVHVHGVTNLRQLEEQITKRSKARPNTRRGGR